MKDKDIRRLKKKIRQIEHLEGARRTLTAEEKAKLATKDEIRRKLFIALPKAEPPPPGKEVFTSHAEVECGTKRGRSATHEAIHAPMQPVSKHANVKIKPPKRPVMRFSSTRVDGQHHQITRIAHHNDGLMATGTEGAAVTVYSALYMSRIATVAGHRRQITGLAFVTQTAQFIGEQNPGHALISACAEGYLIAAHVGENIKTEQIDQHYFYSSIADCQVKTHSATGEELIIVSTEDGTLTVLGFREDEFIALAKFDLNSWGELTIDKNRLFILDESVVRFNIENVDSAPSEWSISTTSKITFKLDREPTSLAISDGEIFCGTHGDNIRYVSQC